MAPKMQRVEILVSLGGADEHGEFNYGPGEVDVPASRAAGWLKAGHARAVGASRKDSNAKASTRKAPAKRQGTSRRKGKAS